MRRFEVGDKSWAICERCEEVVSTTMELRDVPFDDLSGEASQVIAGICDICHEVVAIPAQATAEIAEAYDRLYSGRGTPTK